MAAYAMGIELVRHAILANVLELRGFCLLRRVSSEFKAYVDTALTPRMKMILKGSDLEKTADDIRRLKPKQTSEREALEASVVAEFGPQVSAYHSPLGGGRKAHKVYRFDGLVRRATGKPFCELTSAVQLGAVAHRCESVLPGASFSKESLCNITGSTPTSSASMWSGARDLGVLAFWGGRIEKGGGWRAGGAWEGWLGCRIQPQSCDKIDGEECETCRKYRALLLPRCTMEVERDPSADSSSAKGGSLAQPAAAKPKTARAWKQFQGAEHGRCAGCSGDCDAWHGIPLMRDCLKLAATAK